MKFEWRQGGTCGASVGQVILAAERDRTDRAFDGIVVELDVSIIEEAAKGTQAAQGVLDGIAEAAAGQNLSELHLKPGLQVGDKW